jgi:hypothetical protein
MNQSTDSRRPVRDRDYSPERPAGRSLRHRGRRCIACSASYTPRSAAVGSASSRPPRRLTDRVSSTKSAPRNSIATEASRNEKDTGCGEPAKDQHQADEEHRIPAGTFALARHACGLRLEHPRYAQWNPAHVGEPGSVLIAAQLPRAAAKGNSPSAVTPPVWGAALRVLADAAIAAKEGHHDRST